MMRWMLHKTKFVAESLSGINSVILPWHVAHNAPVEIGY